MASEDLEDALTRLKSNFDLKARRELLRTLRLLIRGADGLLASEPD